MVPLRGNSPNSLAGAVEKFYQPVHVQQSGGYTIGIEQAKAVLDSRAPVGNLGEIPFTEAFLVAEPESAMVGGNNLKVVAAEPVP
jgi:hypothetical protein